MNSNEVYNPKKEVPTGTQLNNRDFLNCLLSNLKDMSKNYVIAMTEASNESLYNKYLATFKKISELQRETYELMFKNGWYKLEKADSSKINKKSTMLNQEMTDLNS